MFRLRGGDALAADQTWTGKISHSMCGADHSKKTAQHADSNAKMSDRDCTLACVKGGSKYVFVSQGKVYHIDNQDYAGLQQHAGHTVRLTGEMNGDTIKLSSIKCQGRDKPLRIGRGLQACLVAIAAARC